MLWKILGALGAYTAGSYVYDVIWRPHQVAKAAREAADRRGKPLLNIGAGTARSSLRSALFGPTLWGDVNMDIEAPKGVACETDNVCYGDAHNIPYPDNHFGAVIASHVIEHVDNPRAVAEELDRVADEVFVIVPKWWAPHAWLHPGHQYFISDKGKIIPLWGGEEQENGQ